MKHFPCTEQPAMQLLKIDVWRYFHPDAIKTVYLQAVIHGIELIGIPVVHELMNKIETHQLVYNTEYGVFQM